MAAINGEQPPEKNKEHNPIGDMWDADNEKVWYDLFNNKDIKPYDKDKSIKVTNLCYI